MSLIQLCAFTLLALLCLLPRAECVGPSVHVANITLTGAASGWPATQSGLGSLNATVTATMCGQLPSGLTCYAFLTLVETAILALHVRVEAQSTVDGFAVYKALSGWASNSNLPLTTLVSNCQTSLGVTVSTLAYTTGVYTVPCRAENTFQFLPSCAVGGAPALTFYVRNSGGSIPNVINRYICGTTSCTGVTVTTTLSGTMTTATVSGSPHALEAFLYYVASVRAASSLPSNPLTVAVGDASAGVSADSIQLSRGGLNATVFSLTENSRYEQYYDVPMACSSETGIWAVALTGVVFVAGFAYIWIWRRTRRLTKRRMLRAYEEDERRIMQSYTAALYPGGMPNAAAAANNAQNPVAPATQWYVDAAGNYYEAPVEVAQNGAAAPGGAQAGDGGTGVYGSSTQQETYYYRDPVTGENYQGLAAQGGTNDQAASGVGEQQLQYYEDPNTGQIYQVAAEQAQGDAEQTAANGEEDVAVDPNDVAVDYNSYYQQNDSVNGAADAENVIDQEMDEANLYNADEYVDPNAGVDGQGGGAEASADPNAEAQEYYQDPETGAYYAVVEDPSTGEKYYQPVETESGAAEQ